MPAKDCSRDTMDAACVPLPSVTIGTSKINPLYMPYQQLHSVGYIRNETMLKCYFLLKELSVFFSIFSTEYFDGRVKTQRLDPAHFGSKIK
jgi:hypothetical protein